MTGKYPDIQARVPGLLVPGVESLVVDGEVVAWDPKEGRILPMQVCACVWGCLRVGGRVAAAGCPRCAASPVWQRMCARLSRGVAAHRHPAGRRVLLLVALASGRQSDATRAAVSVQRRHARARRCTPGRAAAAADGAALPRRSLAHVRRCTRTGAPDRRCCRRASART